MQRDLVVEMSDPLEILRARSANHAVDFVILSQKKLGQIGAVLACNPGDKCAASHAVLVESGGGRVDSKEWLVIGVKPRAISLNGQQSAFSICHSSLILHPSAFRLC